MERILLHYCYVNNCLNLQQNRRHLAEKVSKWNMVSTFPSVTGMHSITRYTRTHDVPHAKHVEVGSRCLDRNYAKAFMEAHLCCVVFLLQGHAVLCLSRSRAISEQSELLCCWRASLLYSLLYCCLSSRKGLLYLCTSGHVL